MNKDIIRKWVDALRSGKYEQHQGALRAQEPNAYCCLGVLCDLVKDEVNLEWEKVSLSSLFEPTLIYTMGNKSGTLPYEVVDYVFGADPDSTDPEVKIVPERLLARCDIIGTNIVTLTILNDSGINFEEIAGVIEANFLSEQA